MDGAERHAAILTRHELDLLRGIADRVPADRAGTRIFADSTLARLLANDGCVGRLAMHVLGPSARPVRAVLFDKSAANNWAVGWHQDRTIAVCARREVDGFGPWSLKAGVPHVAPPFEILAGMVTVRVHLDDCGLDNAPLLVAPGSHRLGRIAASEAAATATKLGIAACTADSGDVWVYATPILHASEPSRVPSRRRVLQVDYAAAALPGGLEWLGIGDT